MPHRVVAAANPLRPRQVVKARLKNAVPCDAGRLFHFSGCFVARQAVQLPVRRGIARRRMFPTLRPRMNTRSASLFLVCVMVASLTRGQTSVIVRTDREVLLGPQSEDEAGAWLAAMRHLREDRLGQMHYSGVEYDRPELKWTQRSFIQPQMMVEDRYLYDPVACKYTVDRYLKDVEKRYGGIDSVLVWAVYCNIGIDWRNQHDMVRAMPGGLSGVRQMVADFHRRGVKVLFPVMPWDVGTRDEGKPLSATIAGTLKEVGADGINGDTMLGFPRDFLDAAQQINYPVVLEPEVGLRDLEMINWN